MGELLQYTYGSPTGDRGSNYTPMRAPRVSNASEPLKVPRERCNLCKAHGRLVGDPWGNANPREAYGPALKTYESRMGDPSVYSTLAPAIHGPALCTHGSPTDDP